MLIKTDLKILENLKSQAEQTYKQLSEKLNKNPITIQLRVKKLRNLGFIEISYLRGNGYKRTAKVNLTSKGAILLNLLRGDDERQDN